jgi:hypothetical protein
LYLKNRARYTRVIVDMAANTGIFSGYITVLSHHERRADVALGETAPEAPYCPRRLKTQSAFTSESWRWFCVLFM